MKRVLLNGKIETIQLPPYGVSLIALPNGNLVYGTYQKVFILNENFQEIKSVETDGWSFCGLNHRNEIYVSDHSKHCIILFDLNLNQLKQFGSQGAGNTQFDNQNDLCFHDDYLYVCDTYKKRIQVLTLDFDYISTIRIDFDSPYKIQISKTTIGVSCNNRILFFDLKSRTLKFEHQYGTCNLNYIDSTFYVSNILDKKFYFFDSNGKFIEEMEMNEKLSEHMTCWFCGSLCKHKDDLYMIDSDGKLLLKFTQ